MRGEAWCRSHHPGLPRSGGAPAGNRNSYRHGLYARWFTEDERRQLADIAGLRGLTGEISVLRVALARLLTADGELTPAERLAMVARGVDAIGRALRTQRVLSGEQAEAFAGALLQAVTELGVGDELRV